MKQGRPPEHGPPFDIMMAEIDCKLANKGIDIPSRPMLAIREVAVKYGIPIPIAAPQIRLPPELQENVALGEAIHRWYTENYGDRLKTNPCPGRMVVYVDGDMYELHVPRIFGSVNFVLTRAWLANPGVGRGPVTCNIVQLLEELTPSKAARLSDSALATIEKAFQTALPAAYTLESTKHRLMSIARGDVEVAVNNLMARGGRYGESKWASLQAAEKVLKAAIDLGGGKLKFTHELTELTQILADSGLVFDAHAQVAAIQCKPAIRYGDELCSRDEALSAHQASLELVNILREAGAKFAEGIRRSKSPKS